MENQTTVRDAELELKCVTDNNDNNVRTQTQTSNGSCAPVCNPVICTPDHGEPQPCGPKP